MSTRFVRRPSSEANFSTVFRSERSIVKLSTGWTLAGALRREEAEEEAEEASFAAAVVAAAVISLAAASPCVDCIVCCCWGVEGTVTVQTFSSFHNHSICASHAQASPHYHTKTKKRPKPRPSHSHTKTPPKKHNTNE